MKVLTTLILVFISFSFINKAYVSYAQEVGVISAFAYDDYKGDGIFNQQDRASAGWKLCLSGGALDTPNCKTTEDSGRTYWQDIEYGTYRLYEKISESQVESGWSQLEPEDAGQYTVQVNEEGTSYYLSEKKVDEAYFGNRLAEIHGHVAYDSNANGTSDPEDLYLGGWQAYLDLNENGVLDKGQVWHGCGISSDIRDCLDEGREPYLCSNSLDGSWHIRDVPKGTYTTRLVLKEGWTLKVPSQNSFTRTVDGATGVVWFDFLVSPPPNFKVKGNNQVSECNAPSETLPYVPAPSPVQPAQPTPSPTPSFTNPLSYLYGLISNLFAKLFGAFNL